MDKDSPISELVDQVDSSEHREVQKWNSFTVAQRLDSEELIETALARSSLTQLRLFVNIIFADFKASPYVIGNFISEDLQYLKTHVRWATIQSLQSFRDRLRASVRCNSPGIQRSIT